MLKLQFFTILIATVHCEEPFIDNYLWYRLIDENLARDFISFIIKFKSEINPQCSEKLVYADEYSNCYYNALKKWRTTSDESKLSCCFLLDYETCIYDLIEEICGRKYRNELFHNYKLKLNKKQMDETLSCKANGYEDIDACLSQSWIIIISIIVLIVILLSILAWIYFTRK